MTAFWHYQIAHRVLPGGDHWYAIREVYDGMSWTAGDIAPGGDTRDELIADLKMMLADAERWPVLELDD